MFSLRMRDARLAGFLSVSRGRIFSLTEKKTRDRSKIALLARKVVGASSLGVRIAVHVGLEK